MLLPISMLLLILVCIILNIFLLNHDHFSYAMDDAYINLSLDYKILHHNIYSSSLVGF